MGKSYTLFDITYHYTLNSSFQALKQAIMNSEAVSAIIAKNPSLKSAKAKLESMETGSYCIHRSWGFGLIKDYDEAEQRLIIDFADKPGHKMDPAFCVSTMDVLPANHLLVRKEIEPAVIAELVEEKPAQLLVEALESYENNAATQIEIEIIFAQVVGADKFKKWWTGARKAIAKDPRISIPEKKTECYILRETPISAEDEILEQFKSTRSSRRRIALAVELLDTASKKDVKAELHAILDGVTESVRDSNQLNSSERLYGAAIRDDVAKLFGEEGEREPSQASLIAEVRDLHEIAEDIPVHFQRRFLDLVNATHPIESRDIVFNLLKVSQGKFTTECINFLIEHDHADELAAALTRWQTEQNLRAPVLLWIVKNRHSKKFAKLLNALITPRLLSAVFFAIDYEALQASTARRIPLGDILSEDKDLIADLLSTADPETAKDLANTLMLNQGFEELTKKSLLARFIKIFPQIQSLVASDAEGKEEQLLVSRLSHDRAREEYETIVSKKIPENSKSIATAREHGDLKENSEYKMAKQDQTMLMARKGMLERDLARARITDFTEASTEQVSVGSIVEVKGASSEKPITYTILGAWDSDPENNTISYKTPLGSALVGKQISETVTVKSGGNEEDYTILSIARYVDSV